MYNVKAKLITVWLTLMWFSVLFTGQVSAEPLTSGPIEADKLFSSAQVNMVALSPGGEYVSIHYQAEKDHNLNFYDTKSNRFIAGTVIGNDNRLRNYSWLNNNQLFLRATNKKGSFGLIFTLNEDKKTVVKLLKTKGYLVHHLPKQKNKVMYAKRKSRHSDYYDLFIIGIDALINDDFSDALRIKHDSSSVSHYIYDADLKLILTSQYNERDETVSIKYASIDGGKWHTAHTIKDVDYNLKPAGFITPDSIAMLTDKDSDKMVLRSFDIKTQTLGEIIYQHPKYDLTSADFTKDGLLNYVTYVEYGLTKTRYLDRRKNHFIQRLAQTFINQEAFVLDQSADANLSLLYVNGSDEPGQYLVYDQQKDQAQRLVVSYPKLNGTSFSTSQQINVTASDGTQIEAFLNLPQNTDHGTLLVMPHGGPIGVQESDNFNQEVQYYTSRGFAVLRVNFRGSAGFGKAFRERGVGEFGQLIEQDISAAVNQVRQQHQFKYMCSIGASYGGYSAVMLAIKHPEQYDCVVAAFGVFDLPLLFNASNLRSGEEYQQYMAKTVGEYDDSMVAVSPVYLSKKLKSPLLLIGGREDDVADFEHTNRFNYVLRLDNHPVETVFYHNTGHGHNYWSGDQHEAAITSDFLHRTLKLTMPQPAELDANGKKAIGDDYATIADAYTFDDNVDNDEEKAFDYYHLAADYDHPRANFNIGGEYHYGGLVKPDVAKAVTYYQKSAALDYADGYRRLGQMYMEGEHFAQDWQKAHDHLKKALALEDESRNNIAMARFYCTAPAPHTDFERCLELMQYKRYKRQSENTFRQAKIYLRHTLSWIITSATLTPEQLQKIKLFATEAFELTDTQGSIEDKREGAFSFKESETFGEKDNYQLLQPGYQLKAAKAKSTKDKTPKAKDKGDKFGLIFKVDVFGAN
ncbi:MAG: dipeptidyl aminopeptidase/acylaminoacyl peptidase, partial [Alteromonadaceae bacterium]